MRAAWLAAGLLLVFALGCQSVPERVRKDPLDGGVSLAVSDPRVTSRLALLEGYLGERHSLVAAAQLQLEGPDLALDRPQRLAVRRPASLRIEILGLFGQVAAILVTDGATYQLWDASSAGTSGGDVTQHLLWDVAQVDLSAAEVARLLLGDPTSGATAVASAATQSETGAIAISLADANDAGTRTIEIDGAGRVQRALRYDRDGVLLWDATFGAFRDVGGQMLAHDLRIEFPRLDARAHFKLDRAELNRTLADSVFVLPVR